MHWLRTRQGTHTKAILGVFVFAWLQAAVVPCVMAHAPTFESSEARPAPMHCPYCPPAAGGESGDCHHATGCVFPHDSRIDARTLSPLLGPPPCQMPGADAKPDSVSSRIAAGDLHGDVPRRPLSVSYCRYLE
jgi:hypothetical protein